MVGRVGVAALAVLSVAWGGRGARGLVLVRPSRVRRSLRLGGPGGGRGPAEVQLRNLPGVTTAELDWAGNTVTPALQLTMAGVAASYGWTFIDAHASVFERHGYCSTDGWIVRVQESPLVEASPYGAVHSNAAGQAAYAQAVVQAVPEPGTLAGNLGALATVPLLARLRRRRGPQPR